MAATAGTLLLRGMKSGKSYTIDLYVPDATATYLTFNGNGLAGTTTPDNYRVPEDVVIEDISVAVAPTAVGATLIVNSAKINGAAIRWGNQLASLNNRTKLALGLRQGDIIQLQQF